MGSSFPSPLFPFASFSSLPFPLPSLFFPYPSISSFPVPSFLRPLPSPFLPSLLLEVGPLLRLGDLVERLSFPNWFGRSLAAKRFLVNCRLKIAPVVAVVLRRFT